MTPTRVNGASRCLPLLAAGLFSLWMSPSWGGALERCLAQLGAGEQRANADLCVVCPDVPAVVRRHALASMLDRPLRCPLRLAEAADAVAFLQDAAARPGPHGLSADGLAALLAELALAERPAEKGWWDRIRRWLRHWLGGEEGGFPAWLESWLANFSPPAWLGERLFQVVLVVVIVLAFVIVVSELRALRWRGRTPREGGFPGGVVPANLRRPRSLTEIRALSPTEQAGALLQFVITELMASGLLPERRDQTNRELAHVLDTNAPALAPNFARLVEGAESAVYGGRSLNAQAAAPLWHSADALLAQRAAAGPGEGA